MPRYLFKLKLLCQTTNRYILNIRAVLFFTGEALDEEDSEDEDSDEDEDDDEDADSDQDEDFDPSKAKENPECKQQ